MRHLTYFAIVLPAYLPLLAAAVPRWHRYRGSFFAGWRDWLPSMLTVAALMAVLDAFSVAQGWWVFNREFFTPPAFAGVPLAELMFFAGAVFFIRFLVVAVESLPAPSWARGPVVHRRRLRLALGVILVCGYLYAWLDGKHPRTILEFGFLFVASSLLLALTPAFGRRETWVIVAVALVLLFAMDSVMNGLGTFTHRPGVGTGVLVFGVFPLEDIPYALSVIQFMIAAPHLLRQARQVSAGA